MQRRCWAVISAQQGSCLTKLFFLNSVLPETKASTEMFAERAFSIIPPGKHRSENHSEDSAEFTLGNHKDKVKDRQSPLQGIIVRHCQIWEKVTVTGSTQRQWPVSLRLWEKTTVTSISTVPSPCKHSWALGLSGMPAATCHLRNRYLLWKRINRNLGDEKFN